MNFFSAQQRARKNTFWLVWLFLLAVAALVVMTNLIVLFALGFVQPRVAQSGELLAQADAAMFAMVGAGVVVVVLIGTVYKMLQLSQGGAAVAEMVGARLVPADTTDIAEKRLHNIVTEMAIASGVPTPPVYVMEEQGINAFAAGYYQRDAVVAVTRGTLQMLNRDELQGVIAHEFSHIFNGDMRINIRLIGILHGILVIGIMGYYILRLAPRSRNSRGNGMAPAVVIGLGLMVVGYAGTFFGNLIKAAVSRQREYLADASAVQFTRNPSGIANALKKIGGSVYGSRLNNPASEEISHTLFSEGASHFMSFLMATHPPLEKRIRSIEPDWDGEYLTPQVQPGAAQTGETEKPGFDRQTLMTIATVLAAQEAIDSIGQPQLQHLQFARQMLHELPTEIIDAANNPYSARAVVYLLLLHSDAGIEQQQIEYLMQHGDKGIAALTLRLSSFRENVGESYRLSLLNLALASLQQLTAEQYHLFMQNVDALIEIDERIELFEWTLRKIVYHTLAPRFEKPRVRRTVYKSFRPLASECVLLLSALWHVGRNSAQASGVFTEILAKLRLQGELLPQQAITLRDFGRACDRLALLQATKKPQLLKACASVITLDGKVTASEAELFRAVAEILDCPMPPLLGEHVSANVHGAK